MKYLATFTNADVAGSTLPLSLDYLTGLEDENDRHPVVEIPVFSNVNKQSNSSKEEYLSFYKYIAESYKFPLT